MKRQYTNRRYLDALEKKVIIFDGAMGTSLQNQNLTAEHFGGEQYNGCNDYLVISCPEAVEKVHRSFLEVGVDALETDTFRSNRLTMKEYNLQERIVEINMAAAQLARKLADEYAEKTGQPRFVAGSIGPSGKLPSTTDPDLSNVTYDELIAAFAEQAEGLIRGGADLLLIETSQDILEVKAAIAGLHQAFEKTQIYLPIQAQVTLDTTGRMLLGTDINAALTILEGMGIDVFGLNCSTGPEHMREPIRFLGENSPLPISCIPNAGLPLNVDGQAVYPLLPEPYANDMYEFATKHNVRVVGGCCGTTPEHLRLLVEKLSDYQLPTTDSPRLFTPQLSSAMSASAMQQTPAPTLLGERCNAQGSRKFKRLLLAEDYDGILDIARDQVSGGAHALDISVAVTERADEAEQMRQVIKKLQAGVDVPLVIDSTEVDVLEVALQTAPGRCLINSTHLESGRAKADKIFALAKKYNAAVICLTIDENGMAKTAQKKYEVAQRIYDIAVNEHGLKPEDLVFDDLTFTLATGDVEFIDSAKETIEGIHLIEEKLPGVMTSLGVSNLSFGFAPQARPALNSVMLYHCVQVGLDMAIVNAAHVKPYAEIDETERELCEDLIFNRREDATQRFIAHFENVELTEESAADPTEGMTPEQRLHWKIVHRFKDGVEADIDEVINRSLIPNPSPERGRESPLPVGEGQGEGKPRKYNPRLPDKLKERIRELRENATDAEALMWRLLRNRAIHDAKFRRQHPIKGYILDFYCHEAKLAIELDGSGHLEKKQIKHDDERTKTLNAQGIRVLRFWNSDVLNNTENVLNEIWIALEEASANTLTPNPSPVGEGDSDSLLPTGEGLGMRAPSKHVIAVHLLNNVLLPAMKEVGDKFGAGELILPFVLQSAETMKKAVAHLENYLEKMEGVTKGTVVIATVYGDVHDIGKNLVKTILSNNGYTVVDLGKQVPAETIITKAVEVNATAIGLSALLVSTSKQMPLIVNELHRRKQQIPVMVGGAAINRRFGRRILQTEDGSNYEAGVFYCKDAFEGLDTMDALIDEEKRFNLLEKINKEATMEANLAAAEPAAAPSGKRSNVVPAPIPLPEKLGQRIIRDMPLEMVLQHLNINELYRLSWGAKNTHGPEWEKLKKEFEARLVSMAKDGAKRGWLKPQAVYGYFACQADGEELIIYADAQGKKEAARLICPRQPHGDYLALSDYFASVESGQLDTVALQVVTVGKLATALFEEMQNANDYTEAYYLHGLAVQAAEATADYVHNHIRRELGLGANQGKRYSWGYPAIPVLEDHFKVFKLLPAAEEELGLGLTASGQISPEESTAAIVVPHKDAKYYTLGETRVEQLMK
ncbi:MAG: homocysteine S-methyltransferase family protein [Anaerolineales bacterium]|nr:homocysteine S-methyltransferase family protein [Anaerolineales bacterium]